MESQLAVWETPEFDEIGVAPEVTMYIAQLDARGRRTQVRRPPW
jgi:coenzyme PQQ precursor peptide PqqA